MNSMDTCNTIEAPASPFGTAIAESAAATQWWYPPPEPLHLDIGAVHVWRINAIDVACCALPLTTVLGERERARAQSLFFAADRSRFTVARAALRILLGAYLDAPADEFALVFGVHGKPALAGPYAQSGIEFNLAHSGDWVLCAFALDRAVGVDVERRRDIAAAAGIASWSFCSGERRALESAGGCSEAFFDIWTRKEARIKAVGGQLFASLARSEEPEMQQSLASDAERLALSSSTAEGLSVQALAVAPGYSAALAVARPWTVLSLFDCRPHFLMTSLCASIRRKPKARPPTRDTPCDIRHANA